jgi:competence ComEA-like helix-hairpin-helix protein
MINSHLYQAADDDAEVAARQSGRRRDIVLWVLLIVLAGSLFYCAIENRYKVNSGLEINDREVNALADKVNPNTASWASLARLPGIGPGKAKAIIKYRNVWKKNEPADKIAFGESNDLCRIKGIGQKTVEQIKDYLVFGSP